MTKSPPHSDASPAQPLFFDNALSRHYTVFDGLAGMQVEALHQDRRGFLWIATADGGLSRFDGVHFDNLGPKDGLPHPTVMAITEIEDQLWFGTFGGGLAVYNGREFQVYTQQEGLPSDEVLNFAPEADGSIWVLTSQGIARFHGDECLETITEIGGQPLFNTRDLVRDANGTIWLATASGIVSTAGEPLPLDAEPGFVWDLALDAADRMWIAKRYLGPEPRLYCYDPRTGQIDSVGIDVDSPEEKVAEHGVRHIRVDRRGWLWIVKDGVLAFDGQQWHRLSLPSQTTDFSSTRLSYEDREGNIWVGLWGGGLIFSDLSSTHRYRQADGLPDREITALEQDRTGRIWIGTRSGLAHLEDNAIALHHPAHDPTDSADSAVQTLALDADGALWTGQPDGTIQRWNGRALETVLDIDDGGLINALYLDNAENLWVVGTKTFARIEAGRLVPVAAETNANIHRIIQDRLGQYWTGSHGFAQALMRFDGFRRDVPDLDELKNIQYVHALCETADGILWIGTATGLVAYDQEAATLHQYTTENGLSANAVTALVQDRDGTLWIGTSGGGVVRYSDGNFQIIRLGDLPLENMITAILLGDQGRIWFGTRDGLVAYQAGTVAPKIVIRQVVAGSIYLEPDFVTYSEDIPELRVVYQGISFRSGGPQLCYRHRLAGPKQTGEWSASTFSNEATYAKLEPGEYRFDVLAIDRDGLASEPVSLEIHITSNANKEHIQALEDVLRSSNQPLLGESAALQQTMSQVSIVAGTDMTMLILGETGTGKGLMSRTIHNMSLRSDQPFIQLNCGAIPEGLIESELFGHEKGAFTGAVSRKIGHFELADGGTLFLDEIGDLPLDSQRVLLHILEENTLTRVGGGTPIPVDVRVIAATNRDLREAIDAGTFREDLFFRLSVFTVELPPLRKRQEDIPLLVHYFAEKFSRHLNRPQPQLAPGVIDFLQNYDWPGNVRELEHLIQRAVVVCQDHTIQIENLPVLTRSAPQPGPGPGPSPSPQTDESPQLASLEDREKLQIENALKAANWIIYGDRGAAKLLNIHPERLRSRMRKYGLKKPKKGKQAQ